MQGTLRQATHRQGILKDSIFYRNTHGQTKWVIPRAGQPFGGILKNVHGHNLSKKYAYRPTDYISN